MTTKDRMALQKLFEKTDDTDCLRDMIEFAAQRLMDLEVEGRCGAMLGVRREGVTEAAGKLQNLGASTTGVASRCSTGLSWSSCAANAKPWSRRRPTAS